MQEYQVNGKWRIFKFLEALKTCPAFSQHFSGLTWELPNVISLSHRQVRHGTLQLFTLKANILQISWRKKKRQTVAESASHLHQGRSATRLIRRLLTMSQAHRMQLLRSKTLALQCSVWGFTSHADNPPTSDFSADILPVFRTAYLFRRPFLLDCLSLIKVFRFICELFFIPQLSFFHPSTFLYNFFLKNFLKKFVWRPKQLVRARNSCCS